MTGLEMRQELTASPFLARQGENVYVQQAASQR
jgi:hypothetical protein